MKVPLIVTLLFSVVAEVPLVDTEPIDLTAFSGGGIIVKCSYEHKYRGNEKFFCKGDGETCKFNRMSKDTNKQYLLYDTNENHFLVLMTKLTTKDSGIYQCVVKQEGDIYKNSTFSLKVKEDPCCGRSTTKIGYVGGEAPIYCTYPNNTIGNIKYFYKQHETTIFSVQSSSALPEDKNKHIIVEDRQRREFRVTFRKLTLADAGVYWCGVGTGGNTGSSSLTAEVHLRVNDPTDQTSIRLSTPSSRVTLESTELTLQSSGDRTLLIASLSVVALVAGLAGVFLYVCKGRKAQGPTSSVGGRSGDSAGQNREDLTDYENDPQAGSSVCQDQNVTPPAVYQRLNPNTTQPDAVYQSLNPNTTQPDAVYQRLNPNTTQPDSVYQSLDPNTTQPDAVYQSLNPNTTQPDEVYQNLNPNTTQPDAVYQS